jgi:hypothetical protein
LIAGLFNFMMGDDPGVSGGIPGGTGPANRASRALQALYVAITANQVAGMALDIAKAAWSIGKNAAKTITGRLIGDQILRDAVQESVGAATTTAASEAGVAGGGKAFSGTAYELKHILKHIEGSAASLKLIAREGAAHVFSDMAALARAENAIFEGGQFTGTVVRGSTVTERFGLAFESPVGYRIAADGSKIPLHYAEAKVGSDGLYHLMPRTGPAK